MFQDIISKIRRLADDERHKFKRSEKLEWVQLCPYCEIWVGSLVDHVKSAHRDKESRQIKTLCPYDDCGKMVVDVKNHINKVHVRLKRFKCEECDSSFTSNHQLKHHVESIHTSLKVECDECGGLFKTTTLQAHIRKIHKGKRVQEPCTEEGCVKVFGSKTDLERHVMSVHMKWKAPCPECGKKVRMDSLIKHVKTAHRGMHNITCNECGQGFPSKKNLDNHVRIQHKGVFVFCRATSKKGAECGKILHSEEGMINHIDCKHMAAPAIISCPECPVKVPDCYLLHHIITQHTNPGQHECLVKDCQVWVKNEKELKKHVDSNHKHLGLEWCLKCSLFVLNLEDHNKLQHETQLNFQPIYGVCEGQLCSWEGCDFMSTSSTHMAGHMKKKHGSFIKCEPCGKKFQNIEEHNRKFHPTKDSLKCDFEYCDKLFSSNRALRMHKYTHTREKVKCEECGVEVSKIRQHMRFVHEKDLRYLCDHSDCQLRFPSNIHLQRHLKQVHQKEREKCTICKKKVSNLKSHIKLVHDKIKDYQCPECEKSFQTRSHLKKHVTQIHLGLREECPECGKKVKDLKSHIKFSHDKVANFPCEMCDKSFVTTTILKKHISSIHLKETIKCPQCSKIVPLATFDQHLRKKHSDKVKKKFICTECQKFFCDRTSLTKHVMHVHMEVREKCKKCGLKTKDIKRHMKNTNCSRDEYVPRRSKNIIGKLDTSYEVNIGNTKKTDIKQEPQDESFDNSEEAFVNDVLNDNRFVVATNK